MKELLIPPKTIAFATTFQCTASCTNCCFGCNPKINNRLSLREMKKYVNVLQERNYSAAVPIDIKDRAVVDFLIRIVSWGFSIKMDAWIAAAIIAKKIKKLKADIKCHCVNRFLVSKVFDLSLTGLYGNCFDYQYRYAVNVEWTEKHSEQNFINISTGE